jgi:activated CDC42 kinase 1
LQEVTLGDTIIVIDGQPEHFYWKGQNQRTFEIGLFPRKIVHNVAGKRAKDISRPLKNSFLHTGHGSSSRGKSWGSPGQIDEVYLKNPMTPPGEIILNLTVLNNNSFKQQQF